MVITLPANPSIGDIITVHSPDGDTEMDGDGNKIHGMMENMVLDISGSYQFIWTGDDTTGWMRTVGYENAPVVYTPKKQIPPDLKTRLIEIDGPIEPIHA